MDNEEPIITDAADLTEEQKREIIREYYNARFAGKRVPFTPERAREMGLKYGSKAGKIGGSKGGKIGGKSTSDAKRAASRANLLKAHAEGKKGGRPRKPDNELKRPRRPPKQTPPQEPPPKAPFIPDI